MIAFIGVLIVCAGFGIFIDALCDAPNRPVWYGLGAILLMVLGVIVLCVGLLRGTP